MSADILSDDVSWTQQSLPADDLSPRFSFILRRDVPLRTTPGRGVTSSAELRHELHLPAFPREEELRVTDEESVEHERDIAAYYRELISVSGIAPLSQAQNYWLRMSFRSSAKASEIDFPYWDRLSDMRPFLNWLADAENASTFWDGDQGWMVQSARIGARLHLREGNLDDSAWRVNLVVHRTVFLARLAAAEARIQAAIRHLKAELGVDPWS